MLRLVISALLASYGMAAQAELPFNPAIEEGQTSYSVSPSTGNVQYHKPSYKRIGDRVYEVSPGTSNIQYHKPSYKIEGNRVYEVSPGTGNIQYHKPSFIVK